MHEHVQPPLAHHETEIDCIVRDHRFSLEREYSESDSRRSTRRGRVAKPGVKPLDILLPPVFRASDLRTALLEDDSGGLASQPAPSITARTVAVQPTRTGSGSSAATTRTFGADDARDTVEIDTPSRSSDAIGGLLPTSTTAAGSASESNITSIP